MVYKIKKDKVKELKDGRNNISIAEKIGCNPQHIGKIFLGERNCSKGLAMLLILINKNFNTENFDIDGMIDTYFDKVEK